MDDSRLKARRQKLGLSISEVARRIGVSTSTVARWESGFIENMKRNHIEAYAKALQLSPLVVTGVDSGTQAKAFFADLRALEERYFDAAVDLSTNSGIDEAMRCMLIVMRELPELPAEALNSLIDYMRFLKAQDKV